MLLVFIYQSVSASDIVLNCEFTDARQYSCLIRNVVITADTNVVGVSGLHLPDYTDLDVERVVFLDSVVHTIPNQIFKTFGHLLELRASRSEVQQVNSLSDCDNLEIFDVSWNKLGSLPNGVFDACSNIKQLNLGYNQLRTLDRNIFASLKNLQTIGLESNGLTKFDFEGLHELRSLALQGNLVNVLSREMFHNMGNVQTLILTNNGISYIDKEILSPLKSINSLLLSQNSFPTLKGDTFHNNPTLSLLALSFNQINSIERNFFDGLPNLYSLELRSNACVTGHFFIQQQGLDNVRNSLERCFQNFEQNP